MKKCPSCNQIYDDSQIYCLQDGTALVLESSANSTETQIFPRKKSKAIPLFIGLLGLIGVLSLVGYLFLLRNNDDNQNKQITANVSNPNTAPTVSPTQTPIPSPTVSPTPTESAEDNTNAVDNSGGQQNAPTDNNPPTENSPPKPVIMKTEDHSVLFGLQECRKSGSSITCELLLTNKGADRRFRFVIYRSNLYDELGNGYNGKNGQLANRDGGEPQIDFVSGVTTKAVITFEGVEPNASKITLMRLQYDVGDDYHLEVKFRNVPLTISK